MRQSASWTLAALAALALSAGVVLACAERTLFRAEGFADRAAATLESAPVRAAVARKVSDAAIREQPDLVAVRPVIEGAAEGILGTPAFRSLLHGAALDLHRSVFDRDADTVTLRVADTGILLADVLQRVQPDVAREVPRRFETALASVSGGADAAALRATERAQNVRRAVPIAFAAALLLGLAAVALAPWRRMGAFRVGTAVAIAAGLLALATAAAPRVVADSEAGREALGIWLAPLLSWAVAIAGAGLVVALAAASVVRPIAVAVLARRGSAAFGAAPRGARAVFAVAAGVVLVLEPGAVVEALTVLAGGLLIVWGISELLGRAAPAPAPHVSARGALRVAAVAAVLVLAIAGAGALAAGRKADAPLTGRCNGSPALCGRTLDEVALVGTHNSMAADREPGWLFAAQDGGIPSQLADGVRALLIDTHYGFATPRGVSTDLSADTKSREKITSELGEEFLRTAERLRDRIGPRGDAPREVFLCHAFCEVGATRAVDALAGVHRFLVTHPEEVLVLSIEDDTSAADTAATIERSGLAREAYRGPVRPPWPTLREMIDRNERVLVMTEDRAGARPWIHRQPEVAQETPYRFETAAALAAPTSCRPNRGGTAGSLLLVNHWVDTSPAPRPSIAREVNARGFLGERLARCRRERKLVPNVVAVDFYREGDVAGVVADVNARR